MFQNSVVKYCRLTLIGIGVFLLQMDAAAIAPPPPDGPPSPVLTGIMLSGPDVVNEENTAQYFCTGKYSDGTTAPVSASWSDDSTYAFINNSGLLSTENVSADENVIITATYGGHSASLNMVIKYVAPVLAGITVSGPEILDEGETAQYTCMADWSDGTTTAVQPTWTEDSTYASISDSGLLSADNVSSDQNITITASFGGQTDTHAVKIKYVAPNLTSITISGATSVDEGTTSQYTCAANWSDGTTTEAVSPVWSVNSSYATISGSGLLSAGDVTSDQNVTLTANYAGKSATLALTIKYAVPTRTGITIEGDTFVKEQSLAQYTCKELYSDGTVKTVTPSWSQDSAFASISASGLLETYDVTVNQSFTITASYDGETAAREVTLLYVAPPVTLTGITISGVTNMYENTAAQFTCTAHYSDGKTNTVTSSSSWSVNSSYASINTAGLLSAGNIESDQSVTVTASYEGKTATQSLTVVMVGTQVIYPLSGIEGKTVMAELWVFDEATETWLDLDEFMVDSNEIVIEDLSPGLWYWIRIMEYNAASETWITVHRNLINM